ncbi:hypothetical protein ACSKAH_002963 [Vibrio vulnificus]
MTNQLNTTNTHGRNQKGTHEDMFGAAANHPSYKQPDFLHSTRLNEDGCTVAFVMDTFEKVFFHYLDTPGMKGFVQCNGSDNCSLCEAGIKLDHRILTPTYNFLEGRMEVLAIPPSMKPTALAPQLQTLFGKGGLMISITKNGYQYEVNSGEIMDGMGIDGDKVLAFKNAYDHNEFSLADIYQIKANEELEEIPQIKARLLLKRGRAA